MRRGNLLDLGIMSLVYRYSRVEYRRTLAEMSDCQTLATRGAAAREDEATLVGSHAGTETVNSNSFFLFWLVGLFHSLVNSSQLTVIRILSQGEGICHCGIQLCPIFNCGKNGDNYGKLKVPSTEY